LILPEGSPGETGGQAGALWGGGSLTALGRHLGARQVKPCLANRFGAIRLNWRPGPIRETQPPPTPPSVTGGAFLTTDFSGVQMRQRSLTACPTYPPGASPHSCFDTTKSKSSVGCFVALLSHFPDGRASLPGPQLNLPFGWGFPLGCPSRSRPSARCSAVKMVLKKHSPSSTVPSAAPTHLRNMAV
jgi:hypothetical protein